MQILIFLHSRNEFRNLGKKFPSNRLFMNVSQKLYQLDITGRSGGILVYIKSHLLSLRLTRFEKPNDIPVMSFEINLR